MLFGQDLGGGHKGALVAAEVAATSKAAAATTVFPLPTSPWRRRLIGLSSWRSSEDSRRGRRTWERLSRRMAREPKESVLSAGGIHRQPNASRLPLATLACEWRTASCRRNSSSKARRRRASLPLAAANLGSAPGQWRSAGPSRPVRCLRSIGKETRLPAADAGIQRLLHEPSQGALRQAAPSRDRQGPAARCGRAPPVPEEARTPETRRRTVP